VVAFVHLAALVGTTLIVVRGTVFKRLQQAWPALFHCSQCFGVWVGSAAALGGIVTMGHGRIVDAMIVGPATSVLSLMTDAVLLKLLGDPSGG
jgi:membrane protease YdiL (CAAX protease family)